MSQTCTCNTCGRTEHNQLLVWNKCEQCQRIEYLESEIANYEIARQEDAKWLEQVTAEREAMREALEEISSGRFGKSVAVKNIARAALKGGKG